MRTQKEIEEMRNDLEEQYNELLMFSYTQEGGVLKDVKSRLRLIGAQISDFNWVLGKK